MGSKRDLWLVRFSDVELRCQRVGVTALPLASSAALSPNVDGDAVAGTGEKREAGEPPDRDFASRSKDSKERLKALRKSTLKAKTRNLYKFIAVASWTSEEGSKGVDAGQEKPTETADGLASPIEDDEEDAEESDVEDGGEFERERHERQSKLSFSVSCALFDFCHVSVHLWKG